jgi:hypothetical protein
VYAAQPLRLSDTGGWVEAQFPKQHTTDDNVTLQAKAQDCVTEHAINSNFLSAVQMTDIVTERENKLSLKAMTGMGRLAKSLAVLGR